MNTNRSKNKTCQPLEKQVFLIKKIKNQRKWSKDEDNLLISLAQKYHEKNWKEIAQNFPKKNTLQCFSRYKRIRPGIVKGSWTGEEDNQIIELVTKFGKEWSKIARFVPTRNGKQIRDRYVNVLDPGVQKDKFTLDEDQKILHYYKTYGPKWAYIVKYFPNRTADMIKNRFHSSVKRKFVELCYSRMSDPNNTNSNQHLITSKTNNNNNNSDDSLNYTESLDRKLSVDSRDLLFNDDFIKHCDSNSLTELSLPSTNEGNNSNLYGLLNTEDGLLFNNTMSNNSSACNSIYNNKSNEKENLFNNNFMEFNINNPYQFDMKYNFFNNNDELAQNVLWNIEDYFAL